MHSKILLHAEVSILFREVLFAVQLIIVKMFKRSDLPQDHEDEMTSPVCGKNRAKSERNRNKRYFTQSNI